MHKNFCYRDRYQRYYNNNRTILWGSVWDGAKVSHRYIYIYICIIFLEFRDNVITNVKIISINFDYFISKRYIIKFIIQI